MVKAWKSERSRTVKGVVVQSWTLPRDDVFLLNGEMAFSFMVIALTVMEYSPRGVTVNGVNVTRSEISALWC